jgi:chemotaxis protein MotB
VKRAFLLVCVGLASCQVPTQAPDADFVAALDDLKLYQAELEDENGRLQSQIVSLQVDLEMARADQAHAATADLEAAFRELQNSVAGLASSGGVEFVDGPDGPLIRISDHVLFASGSVKTSINGEALLRSLAPDLLTLGAAFRVEGHTDNVPVKARAKQFPHGNLQLSARRAVEVAAILLAAGLPAEALTVMGFGEHRPLVSNDTKENRARNRRVEIAVIQAGGATQ